MKKKLLRWAILPVIVIATTFALNAQVGQSENTTGPGIVDPCYIYNNGVIVGLGNRCIGSTQTCVSNPC